MFDASNIVHSKQNVYKIVKIKFISSFLTLIIPKSWLGKILLNKQTKLEKRFNDKTDDIEKFFHLIKENIIFRTVAMLFIFRNVFLLFITTFPVEKSLTYLDYFYSQIPLAHLIQSAETNYGKMNTVNNDLFFHIFSWCI